MPTLWFWLLAGMLGIYVALDGFDFGVGMLHFMIGQSEAERTTLLDSIGPLWDGNEVWLIAAGGTLFAAFPALYAVTFSGFYLPLMIVLWLFTFRALGIEMRHQLHDAMWVRFWDVAFSGASALLAVFFGAAVGNLVRGIPLGANGDFMLPLWTDFRVGSSLGILDWYTLLVALAATCVLAFHGSLWLVLKTQGELCERARRIAKRLFWVVLALGLATSLATLAVQPQVQANLARYPLGALLPMFVFASFIAARVLLRPSPLFAFVASGAHVFLLVLSAAFAVFPHALTARDPARHLELGAAAADDHMLAIMLVWWIPGVLLALGYSYFNYSRMPKKFPIEGDPSATPH
jgi:cytochrome bd ubiquinol oxidase subunit II